MADKTADQLFNEHSADALFDAEPEGGAMGGTGSNKPSKPLIKGAPSVPVDPEAEKEEQRRRMALAISGMTGGQNIASLPPEQREAFNDKSTEKALGQGIALARGAPLVGAHIDELSALLQTGDTKGADYEKRRNEARTAVNQSVADNPALPLVGSLAFAGALPPTAAGRLALSTGAGASEGIGSAPTMKEAKSEGRKGALLGLGTGILGEGLIQAGQGANAAKAGAVEKNRALSDEVLDKAFGSARGKAGGEVSSGSNLLKSAKETVANESLPQDLRDAAAEFLASPKAKALEERVARSNLGRGEDALARIDSAQEGMHTAAANLTPEARAAAAQKRLDDPSRLLRRVRELAPKIALPALGGWLGGAEGAAAGGIAAAALGRSGTTLRNLVADPYVASRLGPVADAVEGAGAMSHASAPALARWSQFLKEDEGSE